MSPIQSWWNWCSESFGHMFLGVTAPILLIAAFLVLVFFNGGGADDGGPRPPRSDVAGVCLSMTPAAERAAQCATSIAADGLIVETATAVPPTPTPEPRSYTVQSGDTLSVICATEAPAMAMDACVAAIVSLNQLAGADAIVAGQALSLPPAAGTPAPSSGGTPAATTTAPVQTAPTGAPESTATPEPQAQSDSGGTTNVEAEPVPADTPGTEDSRSASLVPLGEPRITPDAGTDAREAGGDAGAEPTPEPEPTLPPDLDPNAGRLYVVQPGESLMSICDDQVPDMPEDDCVQFVTLINHLEGPNEVWAHQGLVLP